MAFNVYKQKDAEDFVEAAFINRLCKPLTAFWRASLDLSVTVCVMGLFGSSSSDSGGDTGFASKLRTSSGSQDLDLSYSNDSLGGHGFGNDAAAGDMSAQDFAGALQMQGQMAQLFSKVSILSTTYLFQR